MNTDLTEIRKRFASIRSLRKADIDEWWTGYAFAVLPLAGSWFSALAAGGAVWAAASLVLRRFRLDIPKKALPLVLLCLGLGVWALFTSFYHDGPAGLWRGFLFAAPLFSLPLFIARFRASDPVRSFQAMAHYANYGLAAAALIAIAQMILGQPVEGGVGNSYVFGFVVLSLLTVSTQMTGGRFWAEKCLLLLLLLTLFYVADTRIHLVFLIFYAGVFILKNLQTSRTYKLVAVATLLLFVGIFFWSTFSSIISEISLSGGKGIPQSFGVRLELWKAGLAKLRDTPFLGVGFESKMPEVIKLLPEHLSFIRFTHLHNMFIDAAVAMGVPALILLISIFFSAIYMMSGLDLDRRSRGYAFLAMCVAHGSLGPLLTHDIVASVFVVILAIFASCLSVSHEHRD